MGTKHLIFSSRFMVRWFPLFPPFPAGRASSNCAPQARVGAAATPAVQRAAPAWAQLVGNLKAPLAAGACVWGEHPLAHPRAQLCYRLRLPNTWGALAVGRPRCSAAWVKAQV